MKLNVKAFGLTCGLIWGLGLMIITWWIILWDGSMTASTFLGRVYRGYNFTFLGSIFGLIWGFFDGLIGGIIFAWLYNKLSGKKREK
ncbi:MAG: bacteriophage holin [Candidatus Cloacimonetes bacterium]|nr:bacteriophage holin [Candidatus Cloacimonadota bacterium]MCF7814331.1 bacteriophage holin [Candidatus Cloacimonadota bacterium]MCF7868977.1 bacteriophage holin [Candidatus Cloacimonadota bacterium]MCF7884371.1 bacteriophage holin [Candidatus Cloacimonadota bacterium]